MTPRLDHPEAVTSSVTELIEFSLDALPAMQLPDGVFCFERRAGDPRAHGRSLRYTLMVELGLLRAQAAGYGLPFAPDELESAVWREIDGTELQPGDLGLLLWADARRSGGRGEEIAKRLSERLAAAGGLSTRLGMELGWIVTGLAHYAAAGGSPAADVLFRDAVDQLLENQGPSRLFRHFGAPGRRRRFPNFATQIYSVLALATVARHGLDERALPAAQAAADVLLALQLPDGGWPWLFDVERGTVVERYEVYSVHQDAMAPMALFELAEVTGDERYLAAVGRGFEWIYGRNELGAEMIDRDNKLVLRSIRRPRPLDRMWLGAKTVSALAGIPPRGESQARLTQLNPTDRPYHFGWVLEAWCGREDALRGQQ